MNKIKIKSKFLIFFIIFYTLSVGRWTLSFAQDDNKLVVLSKQIIEAKTDKDAYVFFEELKDIYFKDNKYAEFTEFLKSLIPQKKNLEPAVYYYIAYTRYRQLKYLEEKERWDEYFNQANTFRQELAQSAEKAINAVIEGGFFNVYARLILWQFHYDQQDAFFEQAFLDLMGSVLAYAKNGQDIKPIKDVADTLLAYSRKKEAKELYKIYVDKIINSDIKDNKLAETALGFYGEGKLELAEALYDVYIDRLFKKAEAGICPERISVLTDIAKLFVYQDDKPCDAWYAEKIFKRIEEASGKEVFSDELTYMRAFNLERIKDYSGAKEIYIDLVKRFPDASYADEASFKAGFFCVYALKDMVTGRSYFEKLSKKETAGPFVILSLYQLGLLSQWEGDNVKAGEYYTSLIKKANSPVSSAAGSSQNQEAASLEKSAGTEECNSLAAFTENIALAGERLKEIEQGLPIEYNLKTFLDVSLKEEYAAYNMSRLDLKVHPCKASKDKAEIVVSAIPYLEQSGCLQIELQYLWSGSLGLNKPSNNQSSFNASYVSSGAKEINLVVVSPSGVIDRSFDLAYIY